MWRARAARLRQTHHSAVQHPGRNWTREILESQFWNSGYISVCLGMGCGGFHRTLSCRAEWPRTRCEWQVLTEPLLSAQEQVSLPGRREASVAGSQHGWTGNSHLSSRTWRWKANAKAQMSLEKTERLKGRRASVSTLAAKGGLGRRWPHCSAWQEKQWQRTWIRLRYSMTGLPYILFWFSFFGFLVMLFGFFGGVERGLVPGKVCL